MKGCVAGRVANSVFRGRRKSGSGIEMAWHWATVGVGGGAASLRDNASAALFSRPLLY